MRIVNRAEWGASPGSVGKYGRMPGPVSKVWVHHSVTPSSDSPKVAAKKLESIGMSRFGVFSYSFAIHPDGTVLEGVGWNFVGAHTGGQNSTSYGFVFIGNYENEELTSEQIDSFRRLVARGKKWDKIKADATIDGHQKVSATACPGRNVMARLPALRKPPWEPKKWRVAGVKRKRRTVRGWKNARALKLLWEARGFRVTITEADE